MRRIDAAPTRGGGRLLHTVAAGLLLSAFFVCCLALRYLKPSSSTNKLSSLWRTVAAACGSLQSAGAVAIAVAVVGTVLAALALGWTAHTLGNLVRAAWLSDLWILGPPLVAARLRRWHEADRRAALAQQADDTAAFDRWTQKRAAICPAEPSRPTWMGDQVAAVDSRVLAQYTLDLSTAWPRLWFVVSAEARTEVRMAAAAWSVAGDAAGWGLLSAVAALWWWPAALVGAAVWAVGWWRGREAIGTLAAEIESVVDLYGVELARAMGVESAGGAMDPSTGRRLTALLRKGA